MDKEKYLKNPRCCPYCGSDQLSLVSDKFYGEGDFGDPSKIWTMMSCDDCEKTWSDVYKLVDVEELSEDSQVNDYERGW